MTFIATLLALAVLGAATLLVGFGLFVIAVTEWLVRRLRRAGKAWKVKRALRALAEIGTCDGYSAQLIAYVVEECWNPSIHC